MRQAKIDSLMESITNTAVGFAISLITWAIIARAYGIPMTWGTNLQIVGWFTIVSIARQYILRRLFDGRTVWQAIKDRTYG